MHLPYPPACLPLPFAATWALQPLKAAFLRTMRVPMKGAKAWKPPGRKENMRVSSRRAATLGLSQASFQGLRIAESCPCLEHNPFPQHIRGRLL